MLRAVDKMSPAASTVLCLFVAFLLDSCLQRVGCLVIPVNVTDDVAEGRVIADVRKSLESQHEQSVLNQLTYSFLSNHDSLFNIDSQSGVIRTATSLDRDRLCPGQSTCQLRLDVAVQPAQYFLKVKVLVNFDDVNDSPPSFRTPRVQFNISESTPTRSALHLQAATDPDGPSNGVARYRLDADTDAFELNVSRGEDGSFDLQLVLVKSLDRETADRHELLVTAYDGGTPERSGTVVVDISVSDVNDNSPRFERATYEVEVAENVDVRQRVLLLTVTANDSDAGANGRVVYRLGSRSQAAYGNMFHIDRHTGQLYLMTSLDYELHKSVVLS